MPDNDLKTSLSDILSFNSVLVIIRDSQVFLANALNKAMSDAWAIQRGWVLFIVMIFLVKKFSDRGIGSLVYNLIYLIIALILILIFGWIVIFNIWFFLLYPLSYLLTRILLRRMEVWK